MAMMMMMASLLLGANKDTNVKHLAGFQDEKQRQMTNPRKGYQNSLSKPIRNCKKANIQKQISPKIQTLKEKNESRGFIEGSQNAKGGNFEGQKWQREREKRE